MISGLSRGADNGLILCLDCQKISHEPKSDSVSYCPRCGSKLSRRKPNSLARSWALTLTGMMLYIPANLLPIMTVSKLDVGQPETIMSGIFTLIDKEMLFIAGLVFAASILVPLLKLLIMFWLLITLQLRGMAMNSPMRFNQKRYQMKMYRLIVWIGRWSMLDIFIISLLAGLVQYGRLGTVTAGPAAYAFASVVIITMWAAKSFDPRLLWDAAVSENKQP
ncbi:paraquat-inducible membrane protein A [Endozoicomonas sp. OPT23]|uniref:paraquat-inducible protein A n=1 Tax=Endozoicomonas sp. OPT23 TaxID=2072845 RepID=UPI00129BCB38|nr:paraquat-inducible protein A [Endozoicomonas sp. OPT23]MRI33206.1 paraquat-inducible membrane protein A [Endozoicomonas sp. OPT23]